MFSLNTENTRENSLTNEKSKLKVGEITMNDEKVIIPFRKEVDLTNPRWLNTLRRERHCFLTALSYTILSFKLSVR